MPSPDQCNPELALFEPDIPGNTGTLIRLAACTGTVLHIIEPAGFRLDDTALKRAGMDYLEIAAIKRHLDWKRFMEFTKDEERRPVVLSTKAETSYTAFEFTDRDILVLGRESSGLPEHVWDACKRAISIPLAGEARSLNVALAGAMVLGEALRQTNGFST